MKQNTWFFLRFFPPAHFDHRKLRQAACAPGDHGDHGTSVSDQIDQKTKVGQNTKFFLRFFSPAHFDHWKLRQPACVPGDHGTCVPDIRKWGVDPTIFIVQTCSIAQIEDFFIVLSNFDDSKIIEHPFML